LLASLIRIYEMDLLYFLNFFTWIPVNNRLSGIRAERVFYRKSKIRQLMRKTPIVALVKVHIRSESFI